MVSLKIQATSSLSTLLVAQLVEALRYKSEGRGFHSRWCHWNLTTKWNLNRKFKFKLEFNQEMELVQEI